MSSRDYGRRHSKSRSRSRDRSRRSRSRSTDRPRRSRSRSADRGRSLTGHTLGTSAAVTTVQAMAVLQQQQQLQQQIMAQQLMMQQQQAAAVAAAAAAAASMAAPVAAAAAAAPVQRDAPPTEANRKQREVYVGNLAIGSVTADTLRELFNAVLAHMVPDPVANPPVMNIKMDAGGSGRFGFVELRSIELADAAVLLDKIELCGRQLNVGRPKGYVEPANVAQQAKLSMAQMFAAQLSGGPTNVVLLENLMPAGAVRQEQERRELYDDVYMEAVKSGSVAGIAIPVPPDSTPDSEPCRVYVRYGSTQDATKCKQAMDGRMFDDHMIKASYVTEQDFFRAHQGAWL